MDKKYILLFSAFLLLVLLASLFYFDPFGIRQTDQTLLKKGVRGKKVRELQNIMNTLLLAHSGQGVPPPVKENGVFDQATEDLLYLFTDVRSITLHSFKKMLANA